MEYLREFANHNAYNAAKSSLSLPNVATCIQEDDVHYEPLVEHWLTIRATSDYDYGISVYSYDYEGDMEDIFEKILLDGVEWPKSEWDKDAFTGETTPTEHEIKIKIIGDTIPSYLFYMLGNGTNRRVEIPEGITTLGYDSFSYTNELKEVVLPESITYIDDVAFSNCTGLESITIKATTPPQLGGYLMQFDFTNDCPIYVPAASVNAYKTAEGWSDTYKKIYERIQPIS